MATLHPTLVDWEPPSGPPERIEVSGEQLYGRVCVRCGSHLDGLMDCGYVYTATSSGDRLPWPVKACPHHAGQEAAA
ncbi:hypothetical protein DN069_35265 [Streptacidiphilus pinicola]|uniref:Uncharacterized protein n=1 Tax=Streptacidiphilus pinicola TaxID=2219663 RepID=A0A2X0I907_9ACTN|nr:hypothetical protein [Streptacidiphilus pinicola]RAG80977.1 hypothetical protein DN069_35265 [Streptacidiphilus pinicola]